MKWIWGGIGLGLVACGSPQVTSTLLGSPADVTLEEGTYDGYTLQACSDGETWRVVTGDTNAGVDQVLGSQLAGDPALSGNGGRTTSCVDDGESAYWVGVRDYREMDRVVHLIGKVLVEEEQPGIVQVTPMGFATFAGAEPL